jgi:hypothetical protein
MRGADVLYAQRALHSVGFRAVECDGLFGTQTAAAVRDFQQARGLTASGGIDAPTWDALLKAPVEFFPSRDMASIIVRISQPQQFRDSVIWRLGISGVEVDGQGAIGTPGPPKTVLAILEKYKDTMIQICGKLQVPIELVIATIAVESGGDPSARRQEPGWKADDLTPDRVSLGLMQTLISTARSTLNDQTISTQDLLNPAKSIEAGIAYISSQFPITGFDPPKVGCAYNAGGIYYNPSSTNRWRMRQYPIGSGTYADRLVAFFNDCFAVLRENPIAGAPSFAASVAK